MASAQMASDPGSNTRLHFPVLVSGRRSRGLNVDVEVKQVINQDQLICVIRVAAAQIFGLGSVLYAPPSPLYGTLCGMATEAGDTDPTRVMHHRGAAFVPCV